MNDHTIHLVKESFDLVEPIAPQAAEIFYAKLFALDPSLKPLFRGDMLAQGEKLMQMISVAVSKLDQPQVLTPVLQRLGQRHADYGVRDEHYDTVGTAFLVDAGRRHRRRLHRRSARRLGRGLHRTRRHDEGRGAGRGMTGAP